MPATDILNIEQVAANQNGKEVVINNAIDALEKAANASLTISFAAGVLQAVTELQAVRNGVFIPTAATAAATLTFPNQVNGKNLQRAFTVQNQSGFPVTIKFATGSGATVLVPVGKAMVVNAINGVDMRAGASLLVDIAIDTSPTLAANSNEVAPSQAAVRTYVAAEIDEALSVIVEEAPLNTNTYVRKNGAWVVEDRSIPPMGIVPVTTAIFTVDLTHGGKYLRVNSTTDVEIQVPNSSLIDFPIGTAISFRAVSTGEVSFNPAAGVTLNTSETWSLRKQGSTGMLVKVDANEWDLTGDLVPL